MRITYDDQYLITISEDAVLMIWKIADKEGAWPQEDRQGGRLRWGDPHHQDRPRGQGKHLILVGCFCKLFKYSWNFMYVYTMAFGRTLSLSPRFEMLTFYFDCLIKGKRLTHEEKNPWMQYSDKFMLFVVILNNISSSFQDPQTMSCEWVLLIVLDCNQLF